MQDGRLFLGVAWSVCHLDGPMNNPVGDPDMAHVPIRQPEVSKMAKLLLVPLLWWMSCTNMYDE